MSKSLLNGDIISNTITIILFSSVTGKKLMSKCRSLLQENQDLGKQISQGRVAQLEAEASLHKKHCQELKETYEGKTRLYIHTRLVILWSSSIFQVLLNYIASFDGRLLLVQYHVPQAILVLVLSILLYQLGDSLHVHFL